MERKHLELLTISQIGKLADLNPKSIRYYERIGIFKPAWIDPDTGYRYYVPEQMNHLFAIKTCIHFGIPLRDFPKYYHNGILNTGRCLQDASANFRQSIHQMMSNLDFLEILQTFISHADRLIAERTVLNIDQPEQRFLLREIRNDLTVHALFQVYNDLNQIADRHGSTTAFFYGRIAVFHQGQLEHLYAAVLISRDIEGYSTLSIPAGSYATLYSETSRLIQAPGLFPQVESSGGRMLVFESSCVASQYNVNSPGYILRCIPL